MAEFFKDGGTTKFVDRIAASLGIKAANVKVVSVYQGSVVVDFYIQDDSSGTVAKKGGLANVQATLVTQITSNTINLGAPVLNLTVTTIKASTNGSASSGGSGATTPTPIIVTIPSNKPSTTTPSTSTTSPSGGTTAPPAANTQKDTPQVLPPAISKPITTPVSTNPTQNGVTPIP
jgi:hypothetical protein